MDTDCFIINIKTEVIYEDIANDPVKILDRSNYDVNRRLPMGKSQKVIGLMTDKLERKIMTEFVIFRPKAYSYLIDDGNDDQKVKGTKKSAIKRMLEINGYKNCLFKKKIMRKSQQRFKSEAHYVYTKEIKKLC